jgi:probable HAF family extracellular repeat protein
MRRGGWICGVAVAIFLAILPFAAANASPARGWTLIDIGTLGGSGSYGAAISNSGYVVGCADVPSGGARAFLWSDGTFWDLGTGGGPTTGSSCALAVNNKGVVAGRSTSGELVIWNSGALTRLGFQGDIGAIDEQGVVVGSYRDGNATRAFRTLSGAIVDLPTFGNHAADDSHAEGINARGHIVGRSNGRAFLFDGATLRDLGTLGGSGAFAKGINDRGDVVGLSTDSNGRPRPFIFDGAMRTLPGPTYSGAVAINNVGQVVGSAEGTYGYVIDENGTYTRLDTLPVVVAKGWKRLEPTGINDRGWIVGTASTGSGDLRAFVLIPQSENSSRPVKRSR